MNDHNTQDRQEWLDEMQYIKRNNNDAWWWWAIAIVGTIVFFMLAAYVGPVVFPGG